ncbi:hypothetical protein BGZ93_007218 [Podila epicladia]|nr:hypothetical protein BGZ93_007218 [Podila epicladia]
MNMDDHTLSQEWPGVEASTSSVTAMDAERALDASHVITTPESLKAVSQEIVNEFSVESLTTPAIRDAQDQIQTVALQMDGIRTVITQVQGQMPVVNQQTRDLLEAAEALEKMLQTIDQLAVLVDSVAANVQQVQGEVEEAEKELSSAALQPLQAVLETFKMGPKGFR